MIKPTEIQKAVDNGDVNKIKEIIKSGGNIYNEYIQEVFYKVQETLISRASRFKQIEIFELLLEEYEKDYKIAEEKVFNVENKEFLMKFIFIAFDDDDIQEVLKLPQTSDSNRNCNLVLLVDRKMCVLVPIINNKSLLYKLSKNGFVNINTRSIIGATQASPCPSLTDHGIEQINRLDLLKRMMKIGLNLNDSYQHLENSGKHNFLKGILKLFECVGMVKYCLNHTQELAGKDILLLTAVNKNPQILDLILRFLTKNTTKSNEDYLKEFVTDYDNVNFSIRCCFNENFELLTYILVKYKINVIDYTEEDKPQFYKSYLKNEKSLKYLKEIIKFQNEKLDDILGAITLGINIEIVRFIWSNLRKEHFKRFEESIILIIKLAYDYETTIERNILKFIEQLDPHQIYDRYIRNTALFVAMQIDCEPIVYNLISRGANLLHKNSIDDTALTTACEFSSSEIIRIILKMEPSLINEVGHNGFYPITKLVCREKINIEIFNKFIRKGARTDVRCSKNNTLLHHAVSAGRIDLVKRLLELGVDPSLQNDDGQTVINLSTKRENLDIFNLILDSGKIDIEAKSSRDHTILYRTCKSFNSDFFFSLFEKTKPNVCVINHKGQTPLFWCYDVQRCEKLLQLGTDPTIVDENNFTYYTFAALDFNEQIAEFSLKRTDFDLTIMGNNGYTLLHPVCGMNIDIERYINNENVKELFRKCTNAINSYNHETPFHIAANNHKLQILKFMFELAEPNLENRNEKGETPIFGNLRYIMS